MIDSSLSKTRLPKVVWAAWLQGEESAPEIVRCCLKSWRIQNPDWSVYVLNARTAHELVDVGLSRKIFHSLGLQMQANLIRLALLENYGGVWVDATTLCTKPLRDVLEDHVQPSGFFAFTNASRDRLLSNWFLASTPGHPLVRELRRSLLQYFRSHPPKPRYRWWQRALHKLAREMLKCHPAATGLWLRQPLVSLAGHYPYFLFHYTFASLYYSRRGRFRSLWRQTPVIFNSEAKLLSRLALNPCDDHQAQQQLDAATMGIFKLTWKNAAKAAIPNATILATMLEPYR